MTEMDGRPSTMLVRRNREIAEVREETIRMDQRLDAAQAVNHTLQTETSSLDSNVAEQNARAAVSEQRLADLFYKAESADEALTKQRTAHHTAFSALQAEAIRHREQLANVESEVDVQRTRTADIGADLGTLQSRLQTEEETLAELRAANNEMNSVQARASGSDSIPRSGAVAAKAEALEDELHAINSRQDAQRNEAASAKRRVSDLRDSLQAERQRRDEFSNELRAAVAEQASDAAKLQELEATIAARGGDVAAMLENIRSNSNGDPSVQREAAGKRTAELRSELQTSEDQLKSLKVSLEKTRARNVEDEARDRAKLDKARSELQTTVRVTAEAHGKEIALLEDEIMTERQQANADALAEMACADQIAQLQQTRARLETERSAVGAQAQNDAGRCASLRADLSRLRTEVQTVEMRTTGLQHCKADCEKRAHDVQAREEQQSAHLRGKLEDLWRNLGSAKNAAGC